MGERAGQFRTKVSKDLAQVASLLYYFNMVDPDAIKEAWADALSRGPEWRKRAVEGRKALAAKAPELVEALLE
nr:hypothetical protein [Aquabacterium sp.]